MKQFDILSSLHLFPKEMVYTVLSFVAEDPKQEVWLEIATKGFASVTIESATKRKEWHIWGEKNHLHHFGFVDRSCDSETTKVYKCPDCQRWRYFHHDSLREETCCSDDYGDATCPDSYYVCAECDEILIYSRRNLADGVLERSWARNNKILFMKKMDYGLAKRVGLTRKAIRKILLRRRLSDS